MTNQQIKDYLEKYSLTTKEKLAEHIEQLKRNTKPNTRLISELSYALLDEENLFFNFFGGEKVDWINFTGGRVKIGEIFTYRRIDPIVGDLEGINKPPQKELNNHILEVINDVQQEKKSAMFLDEVLAEKESSKVYNYYDNIIEQKEELVTVQVSVGSLIVPKEKQVEWAKEVLKTEENKGHSTRLKANTLVFDKDCNLLGEKTNKNKPQISLLFKQFPKALEAIAKCSEYGHQKYKESDLDFLNYQRVYGGSKTYADAGLRHRLEQGNDLESGLPHQFHVAWNALAELEIWIKENS